MKLGILFWATMIKLLSLLHLHLHQRKKYEIMSEFCESLRTINRTELDLTYITSRLIGELKIIFSNSQMAFRKLNNL